MAYALFGLIYGISLVMVWFVAKKRYSRVNLSEVNVMLSEILETNFKNSSLSNAAESILIVLKRFYRIDYVTILIYNEASQTLEVIASNTGNTYLRGIEGYCNSALKDIGKLSAKVLTSAGMSLTYPTASEREITFSNFTPLGYQGKIIGAILLENQSATALSEEKGRLQLYDKVFKSTALVLHNVLHTENLIKMTSTDQLTVVYNRRFIDMTLPDQLAIHRNLGLPFSVSLFDIDHFKKFNDTYGHAFGDLVLKEVAAYMKKNLGDNAWVARYGGEEFVLFFGRCQPEVALKQVEALREGLSQLQLTDGTTVTSVTASFGVASFPQIQGSGSDLIACADEALYDSKKAGRNRVTVASRKAASI